MSLTSEVIKAWRTIYAVNLNHEVAELRAAALQQVTICDMALRAIETAPAGIEPRGCPTPGACSCPPTLSAQMEGMASGWISVKDRVPMDHETVIVEGGIAYLRKGEWMTLTGERYPGRPIQWEVTHWQPMPKGPSPTPQGLLPK